MFAQHSACILGLFNLILAGIAIYCVTVAEDQPEYFALVYIAVSIFMFYMGTILIIIIVQLIETYREQHPSTIERERLAPSNDFIEENKPQIRLSRSRTVPSVQSVLDPHGISEWSEVPTTSSHRTLLPKCQDTVITIHRNYQSFGLVTRDQHDASEFNRL